MHLDDFGHQELRGRSTAPPAHASIVGGIHAGKQGGLPRLSDIKVQWKGASPEQFDQVAQPGFLAELAHRSNVSFPQVYDARWAPKGSLLKQISGTGGLGVTIAADQQPIPRQAYAQRRVTGKVLGATFVSDGREAVLLGVSRLSKKRIGQRPFVFAGAVGPVRVSRQINNALRRIGQRLVKLTEIAGPLNIDVIVSDQCVHLLEVNPRWSASMELVELAWMERLTEPCSFFDDFSVWQSRLNMLDRTEQQARNDTVYMKRIVFARTDQWVSPNDFPITHDVSPITHEKSAVRWTYVPNQRTLIKQGHPIATLIARRDACSLGALFRFHHEPSSERVR